MRENLCVSLLFLLLLLQLKEGYMFSWGRETAFTQNLPNIYGLLTRFLPTFPLTAAIIQSRIINRIVDLWNNWWLVLFCRLPPCRSLLLIRPDVNVVGGTENLPPRGRSSNNSHWLIPTMEPLMIYLFGNDRALGELEAIDNKTLARGRHFQRFNTSLPPEWCFWKHVCIYSSLLHQIEIC